MFGSAIAGAQLLSGGKKARWYQQDRYDESLEFTQDYRDAGQWGVTSLKELLADPSSFLKDPSYQFQKEEGLRGLEGRTGAQGLGLSGATLRAMTKYSGDLASMNYNQRVQQLFSLSNMGLSAADVSANRAMQQGQIMGKNLKYIGEAGAAQTMGVSEGLGEMFGGMGGGGGGGMMG